MPQNKLICKKISYLAACIAAVVVFFLSSTSYSSANSSAGVGFFGTASFTMLVLETMGAIAFLFVKRCTTRTTLGTVGTYLRDISRIHFGLALMTAVLALVEFFKQPQLSTFFVVCGYAVCGALSLYVYLSYSRIPIGTEKNDELTKYKDLQL